MILELQGTNFVCWTMQPKVFLIRIYH